MYRECYKKLVSLLDSPLCRRITDSVGKTQIMTWDYDEFVRSEKPSQSRGLPQDCKDVLLAMLYRTSRSPLSSTREYNRPCEFCNNLLGLSNSTYSRVISVQCGPETLVHEITYNSSCVQDHLVRRSFGQSGGERGYSMIHYSQSDPRP